MFPELDTMRLLLQEIKPKDQAFIFEGLSHPEVIPYYGVRYNSFEATEAQMDWYSQLAEQGSGLAWKMVEKQTGEKVGVIAVYAYKPEHNKAEVGFWLLPQFWNKGYASEALQSVNDYWKKVKSLHRMEAFVEEGNTASSKLLEKAGFHYEGTMRDCEIKHGKYISLLIYALLLG
ncbi:MAG TPA: GNAT family N-acetyltransferase [Flavisolibacter sp.]|jgi:ribosomal-protein-alanine N-acetyltransferase|nr:GNAT family N-acetyltransferase [Flavisolibacter sp.]